MQARKVAPITAKAAASNKQHPEGKIPGYQNMSFAQNAPHKMPRPLEVAAGELPVLPVPPLRPAKAARVEFASNTDMRCLSAQAIFQRAIGACASRR